jgi:hypothetical protein
VVVGPPGAGKTALVAGWLTRDVPSGPRKVVWIDVSLAPSARSVWTRLRDALVELGLAMPERWSQGGVDPSWGTCSTGRAARVNSVLPASSCRGGDRRSPRTGPPG